MKRRWLSSWVAAVLSGFIVAGCMAQPAPTAAPEPQPPAQPQAGAQPQAAPAEAPAAAPADAPAEPVVQFAGKLSLAPTSGPAGTRVTAAGTGLPANTRFQLLWNTVQGSWVLKGEYNEEFHGREFKELAPPLAEVTTDGTGSFETGFNVPEDWGFDHTVTLVEVESGTVRNQANFSVDMQVSISPTSGPPGTPITIDLRGIGYKYMENSWVLTYDNKVTGWLSSVTTNGRARAVIPAAGGPGRHVLQVTHGWSSVAYLNTQQSPQPDRPAFEFAFTVTDGQPVLPPPAESQGFKAQPGSAPAGTGPALWTDPAGGPVGAPVKLLGRGLTPGQQVELTWSRMEGNRVTAAGFSEATVPMGTAVVADDGTLAMHFPAPDDLGGPHRIQALAGDKVLATASFNITPSLFALEPARGPVGTTFRVHLKGVGWTETANIYTLTYDNAYLGFACAFNSQGDVEVFLKATGEPGWHFIDLYPAIYRGKDIKGVQNFRYPQLTGDVDHPGERLPIFRLAFEVTE